MDFPKLVNFRHVKNVTPAFQFLDINKSDLGKVVAQVASGGYPVVLSSIRCRDGYFYDRNGGKTLEAYGLAVVISLDDFHRVCDVAGSNAASIVDPTVISTP